MTSSRSGPARSCSATRATCSLARTSYTGCPGTGAFAYVPLARADPRVFHLAQTCNPDDQFVVVIRDRSRIGIYQARMVSDSEIAFLGH